MKKKILAIGLVVCMLVVAIGSATMAYFTDTESASNVMTVGKIDIVQHEKEKDGSDFKQDKPLLPNVTVDKVVTIENTGNADAYFRTFVAFEGTKEFVDTYLHNHITAHSELKQYGEVRIGGIYTLYIYEHPEKLEPGETSDKILIDFTLDSTATQEDVAFARSAYNVWVVTEAVQADGFDNGAADALNTAFGTLGAQATATPYKYTGYQPFNDTSWYDPAATEYTLSDREDMVGFAGLVNDGVKFTGKTVNIDGDIDLSDIDWEPLNLWNPEKAGMTINGNGHTISNLSVDGGSKIGFIGSYAGTGDMVIKNLTFKKAEVVTSGSHAAVVIGYQYGHVTMDKVTVTNSTVKSTASAGINHAALVGFSAQNDGAVLDVVNCTITKNTISGFHGVGTVVGKSASDSDSKFSVNGTTITDNTLYYTATGGQGGHEVGAGSYGYVDAAYTGTGNTFKNNKILYGTTSVEGKNLAKALANAQPGDIITLTSAPTADVTVGELKDVTINANGYAMQPFKTTADTKLENVTLMNANFAYTGATVDCGVVIDANAQIENLVISNCNFTGTGAKAGRGISGFNNAATITLKDCTFKDLGYPIYAWGGYEALTVENCVFENIKSWAIMPQSGFDGDLTVTNCQFIDCLGGGLIKAGTLTAGHTFTFTDNTVTGCTIAGDHNWFQFNASAGTVVMSGNTMDGAAWTPGVAEGLK